MSRIYILSNYDEYGAEDVKATTNRDAVMDMLRSYVGEKVPGYSHPYPEFNYGEPEALLALLASEDPGKYNLSEGWGGFQLHIVDEFQSTP
ncbi:MAG TPA: hypothetical protein VM621_10500 [Luteibacter sp.]|uniref:hypothetical protein n=1 Tax=Luteibacter sp. TaxID=1886636 RepID=UPI002CE59840|nr:hypothetical protein [Luteibacter sp.]HVI55469.1 hypothetical protein [Luteibacter sp.]